MSTLIMLSGAFISEPTIEYSGTLPHLKDFDPYLSSDYDLEQNYGVDRYSTALQRPQVFSSRESLSSDSIHSSESPLSNISSASEFMTSIATGQTTPVTSLTPESESSILSYQGEANNMTATVTSYLEQGWGTMDSFNARSLEKQNSVIAGVESSSRPPFRTQSSPLLSAPAFHMINSSSPHSTRSSKAGNLQGLENEIRSQNSATLSEQRLLRTSQPTNISYSGENSVVSDELTHRSSSLENSILSPISEKSVIGTSVGNFRNIPETIAEDSPIYSHNAESAQRGAAQQSTKTSLSASLTAAPTLYQQNFASQEIRNDTTTDHGQEFGLAHDYQSTFTRNRQHRHHSYTEGRRPSTISPPSPPNIQNIYENKNLYGNYPLNRTSMENTSNPTFSPRSETDIKPYLLNAELTSNLASPHHIKKSLSIGAQISSIKPEIVTQHSYPATSFGDDLFSPSGQIHFRGLDKADDTLLEPKRNFISMLNSPTSSSTTFCDAEQMSRSPQQSPTDLSVGSPRCHSDYHAYQQQEQQASFDERLRHLREQQQVAGLPDLFGAYKPTERSHYMPHDVSPSSFSNQLPPSLTSAPFLKQENDTFYGGSLPYNGQMYTIPTALSNYRPFRTHYSTAEQHHPYASHHERIVSSNFMTSTLRPSSEGLCAVCGDNAACQHYGVRTCEGCKGFFKRTVQKKSTYVCLANKNCPVDKRRRNRCQFCRFEKCLAVGMVKEVVRTDHLKGRRGRLPSKPKGPKDLVAPPSPPVSFITSLVRAHVDTNPAISNTDISKYRPPGMPPCSPPLSVAEEAHSFYELLASCLAVIRHWTEKIPGFSSLNQEDQTLLIESSFMEIFAFRLAYRSEIQEGKLIFCNGLALHRDQLLGSFGDWIDAILSFACSLSDLNVDLSSFSCMLALLLFQDRPGLRDSQKVEEMQGLVIESLKEHVSKSCVTADRPNFFMKLLAITPEIHALASLGSRTLYRHKVESPTVPFPPCLQRTLELLANFQ